MDKQKILNAIRKAHEAGDTNAAKRLAAMLNVNPSQDAQNAPVEKQKLRALAQGLTLGFGDEIEAGIRNPMSALGLSEDEGYSKDLEDIRGKIKDYRGEYPVEAIGMEVGGAVLPALAAGAATFGTGGAAVGAGTAARLAPTLGRLAGIGAAEGAVAGFGAGEGGLANRAEGAAIGGTLGGVLGAVAPAAIGATGRRVRSALDGFGVGGKQRGAQFADRKILEALERDEISLSQAGETLARSRELGMPDMTLADLGENMRGQGFQAQSVPSSGRNKVINQFANRTMTQAEQIADETSRLTGVQGGGTGIDFVDEMAEKISNDARGAYSEAYKIDLDAAPFQNMAKSSAIQDAYKKAVQLADVDPNMSIEGMPKDLGAFLSLEAGNNVRMPTEVAHTIKQGLDALVDAETDNLTKKMTPMGRKLVMLKNAWNKEIVNQNELYAAANKQFADNSKVNSAYQLGYDFTKTNQQKLARTVSSMSDGEKKAFRVGIVSQVEELTSKTGDSTDFVRTLFGTPRKRAALRLAFDSTEQFEQFEEMITLQAMKQRTAREVLGGSQTAARQAQQADSAIDPSAIIDVGAALATGNPSGMLSRGINRMKGMSENTADALGKRVFDNTIEGQQEILNNLAARQSADEIARNRLLRRPETYSGLIGATAGSYAGNRNRGR